MLGEPGYTPTAVCTRRSRGQLEPDAGTLPYSVGFTSFPAEDTALATDGLLLRITPDRALLVPGI